MYKNITQYLNLLESKGELTRIETFVDTEFEMAEIADRCVKGGRGALLFTNNGTQFPVAMNIFGTQERMALALGYKDLDEIAINIEKFLGVVKTPKRTLGDKLKMLPTIIKARNWMPRHSKKRGECQQVIDTAPDLAKLPILKTWPHDGGRFITLPMVHTMDAVSGERNVGMYRAQVFSSTTLGLHWHKHKTGARHYESYAIDNCQLIIDNSAAKAKPLSIVNSQFSIDNSAAKSKPLSIVNSQFSIDNSAAKAKTLSIVNSQLSIKNMPIAITLGGDPCYTYCATAPLPDGVDEYMLAGFLRNKPVKLVKCITSDLEVPHDCDFVIEGYVDVSADKVIEGPFGDHTGFYSLADLYPTMTITCITHRKGAIFPATVVGPPPMEDAYIALATEKIFLPPIKALISPEIIDLTMPWQGVAHNLAIATIDKRYDGAGFKVASALWGAGQMAFCKFLVVSEHAFTFSLSGICAEVLITRGVADVLDHAGEDIGLGGKICFDTSSSKAVDYTFDTIYDDGVDALTDNQKLWILLANVNPSRDIKIDGNVIHFDARSKQLQRRDFPNIVTMDDATIKKVDSRWLEYGLGEFITSPSLKYKNLVTNGAIKIYASPSNNEG